MSRFTPLPANLCQSQSATGVAASENTYHSFHDIELYESSTASVAARKQGSSGKEDEFEFRPILRHDSGYESIHPGSRSSASRSSQRHNSTISISSSQAQPQTQPSIRRVAKSMPPPHMRRLSARPSRPTQQHQQHTYYYFPPPESLSGSLDEDEDEHDAGASYPPPPQTTHYWTSDHTRRLEYAAIDAASRGVKGWFMKHVVPDCFVPKANRRVGFDDDSGSVRRYRLDLDCDETEEKEGKKLGWLFGR